MIFLIRIWILEFNILRIIYPAPFDDPIVAMNFGNEPCDLGFADGFWLIGIVGSSSRPPPENQRKSDYKITTGLCL